MDKNLRLQHRFMKEYKKNTLAIFLCFTLSIALITTLLILIHTNHKMENIQSEMLYTDSDCSVDEIDNSQVETLARDPDLAWHAVQQLNYHDYQKDSQFLSLFCGDDDFITLTAKLTKGRLPKAENEVAAERWTLLNLGIEPECGQTFEITNTKTQRTESYHLVGILSDMASNKKYGLKCLYAPLTKAKTSDYTVFVRFKDGTSYQKKTADLAKTLGIQKKQIRKCPGRENLNELWIIDLQITAVLVLICLVIFYGIYRIAMMSRKRQYGVLRAVGMKRRQLQQMILLELYEIYLVSIPAGAGTGFLVALLIAHISGDSSKEIYLHNQSISFAPVFPVLQILICILVIAALIGFIGYLTGRKLAQETAVELLSNNGKQGRLKAIHFKLREQGGRLQSLFSLASKYIIKDKRTSLFVVLTICVGVTLFTALAYQKEIAQTFREDTKEMYYLNGQYEMGTLQIHSRTNGISRDSAEKIAALKEVHNIKTMAGIPIRVVDDQNVKRQKAYYDDSNRRFLKYQGYPLAGNDGTDQIYKSILYGYNKAALTKLKNFVIDGDFDENGLKEDEIILSVLHFDDTKQNKLPGNFKEGTPLMEYRAGDKVVVKYRKDFDTGQLSYEQLSDRDADYVYKTYKVVAIVSFPYMYDCNITIYPLLITGDDQVQKLCSDSHFQRINLDGIDSLTKKEQGQLERALIKIGNQNENISTRSMISDIENNEMLYWKQMVYIIGIALISFILVLINMINNLSYRMRTRTQEICMLRAIGMSVKMIRRMMVFENGLLGLSGVALAYLCANPILRYLYQNSDMKSFGHAFHFDYGAFAAISLVALLVCVLLASFLSKDWKTKQIMERMNQVE